MAEQQNNMYEKCCDGRVEKVREALAAGADPNARGGFVNSTCLMVAALRNYNGVVELLLSTPGIQVNAKTEFGTTALHEACDGGSLASLALIVKSPGVQFNERDDYGWTPIMRAIWRRQTQAILQMAAVPDVCLDVRDEEGRSLEEIANQRAGEAAPDIVQVLGEARQRRRLVRLVKEQKSKVRKVLLDGLLDPESNLSKLRMPAVKSPLMKIIWDKVTEDWQVFNEGGSAGEAP